MPTKSHQDASNGSKSLLYNSKPIKKRKVSDEDDGLVPLSRNNAIIDDAKALGRDNFQLNPRQAIQERNRHFTKKSTMTNPSFSIFRAAKPSATITTASFYSGSTGQVLSSHSIQMSSSSSSSSPRDGSNQLKLDERFDFDQSQSSYHGSASPNPYHSTGNLSPKHKTTKILRDDITTEWNKFYYQPASLNNESKKINAKRASFRLENNTEHQYIPTYDDAEDESNPL